MARSLSRMPSAVAVSQCGTRWCSGHVVGQTDRTRHDRVVVVVGAVGCVGMRQVGDAEQQLAQRRSTARRARRRAPARRRRAHGSRPAAPRLPSTSPSRRSWPTSLEIVLTRARMASRSCGDVAQAGVEASGLVDLVEQRGPATAAERRATPARSVRRSRWSITPANATGRRTGRSAIALRTTARRAAAGEPARTPRSTSAVVSGRSRVGHRVAGRVSASGIVSGRR